MKAVRKAIGKMIQQAEANEAVAQSLGSAEALQLMSEARGLRHAIDLACEAVLIEEGRAVSGITIAAVRDRCKIEQGIEEGCRHTIGEPDPQAELRQELVGLQGKILSGHGEEHDRTRVREIKALLSAGPVRQGIPTGRPV